MQRSRFTSFLLVLFLILAQGAVLLHGLEHGAAGEEHHSCSLCIAGHNFSASLPSVALPLDLSAPGIVLSGSVPEQLTHLIPPLARQRGPPLFS